MEKIQQFLRGFYEMTFQGKGAFWGVIAALLLLILVYAVSDRLRQKLGRKSGLLLLVPALLLGAFAWLNINACGYVPLDQRAANAPAYAWEQITRSSENTLSYTADLKDPATGAPYRQTFAFGDVKSQLTFKETSDHVGEAFTIASTDGASSITFRPDGAYVFRALNDGVDETGVYAYVDKVLTLTPAGGEEIKVGKTSSKLRYTSAVADPATGEAYKQEYAVKELKEKFVIEETAEYVPEALTVESADGASTITFSPDGTYQFALAGGETESGRYIYRNGAMTLANAEGSAAFWNNFWGRFGWLVFAAVIAALMIVIFLNDDRLKTFMNRHPLLWLLIPAALLIYFVYVAIGWNLWVSVSDWPDGVLNASYGFGGFGQYSKMFADGTFWNAVWNTLKLFLIIPICLLLGMGLALVMDQGLKGTPVFRTLILLPFALSFVVTGLIWQQMYDGRNGILMSFFNLFGIASKVDWTGNQLVMYSIMLAMIWQFSGYVAVIFLAAIKNVPTNIINAAKLDGAYMPRIYWKMIIPQLTGAMGSCITILAMYALRSFDLIYSLTSYTNPASTTLPIMMYVEAFSKNNYAYAAAISCFLLALVLVLILPLTYWTNRRKG